MAATYNDAQLILQLYDLRREAVMRKARNYVAGSFWPSKIEDVLNIFMNFGSEESAYLRQVISYWENAAALVNHGALDASLFVDTNGEMIFVYAKFQPFLAQIRETINPNSMRQIEQLIENSPKAQAALERTTKMLAEFAKKAKEAKKGKEAAAD